MFVELQVRLPVSTPCGDTSFSLQAVGLTSDDTRVTMTRKKQPELLHLSFYLCLKLKILK